MSAPLIANMILRETAQSRGMEWEISNILGSADGECNYQYFIFNYKIYWCLYPRIIMSEQEEIGMILDLKWNFECRKWYRKK